MASFGWKRKSSRLRDKKTCCNLFSEQNYAEDDDSADIDWLGSKRLKVSEDLRLEDRTQKSRRLKDEGTVFAEAERYWEAIKKWDEAIEINGTDETLFEMKAQSYLALNEVFPAVQAAELAVKTNPRWWIAYQTLGRTQLGIGRVKMALISFCKAIHLKPDERELWDEDLAWAKSLLLEEHERK